MKPFNFFKINKLQFQKRQIKLSFFSLPSIFILDNNNATNSLAIESKLFASSNDSVNDIIIVDITSPLSEIMESAYKSAERRNVYGENPEQAIIDKLYEEVGELEDALYCNNYKHFPGNQPKDNEKFKAMFEEHIKDTVQAELIDIILVSFCALQKLGIEPELAGMYIDAQLRYNSMRALYE